MTRVDPAPKWLEEQVGAHAKELVRAKPVRWVAALIFTVHQLTELHILVAKRAAELPFCPVPLT